MAIKSSATLRSDNAANVTTQTAPESISPTLLGGEIDEQIESAYNQIDGIAVTGMVISAAFTSYITNGMLLPDILTVLMARIAALQVAITGGIQGLIGEFLAIITPDTNQSILVNETLSPANTYRSMAKIKLPNDASNGGFDNGNSWLLNKFVVPAGGQPSVKFSVSELVINIIENNITTALATRTFALAVCVNGTPQNSFDSSGASLLSGNFLPAFNGTSSGKHYFIDSNTGTIAVNANDVVTLELQEKRTTQAGANDSIRIQIINGFFNNELI